MIILEHLKFIVLLLFYRVKELKDYLLVKSMFVDFDN
jgi:hypothetical protein